ncbi:MAG: hypothetical protein ABIP75_08410 [Pyrinomonadaceae bacterium]
MSNQINLSRLNISSEPFRNRTLPWVVVAVVAFISLVLLVYFVGESRAVTARANAEAAQVAKLKEQEKELKKRAGVINNSLTAEQKQLIVASHELIDRKYFSWSWLFEDLEAVLPSETKVTQINVREVKQIEGRTVADLQMSLMGKNYISVTGMISSMDRSGVFQTELTEQNLQKGDQKNLTEWTLHIIYRQRAGTPVASPAPVTSAVKASSDPDTVAGLPAGSGGSR